MRPLGRRAQPEEGRQGARRPLEGVFPSKRRGVPVAPGGAGTIAMPPSDVPCVSHKRRRFSLGRRQPNSRLMTAKAESIFLSSRMMVNSLRVETTSTTFNPSHASAFKMKL